LDDSSARFDSIGLLQSRVATESGRDPPGSQLSWVEAAGAAGDEERALAQGRVPLGGRPLAEFGGSVVWLTDPIISSSKAALPKVGERSGRVV
jgi:hypothetical protein